MSAEIIALPRTRFDELKVGDIFRFGQRMNVLDSDIHVSKKQQLAHEEPYVLAWQSHDPQANLTIYRHHNHCKIISLASFRKGGAFHLRPNILFEPVSIVDHVVCFNWAGADAGKLPEAIRMGSIFSEPCASNVPRIGDAMVKFDGKKCHSAKAHRIHLDGIGISVSNNQFTFCYRQDNGFSRPVRRHERQFAYLLHG